MNTFTQYALLILYILYIFLFQSMKAVCASLQSIQMCHRSTCREGQHTVLYHADFLYDACFYIIMQTFASLVSVFSITHRFSLHKRAGNQNLFFLAFLLLHLFKEQSGSRMPDLL